MVGGGVVNVFAYPISKHYSKGVKMRFAIKNRFLYGKHILLDVSSFCPGREREKLRGVARM